MVAFDAACRRRQDDVQQVDLVRRQQYGTVRVAQVLAVQVDAGWRLVAAPDRADTVFGITPLRGQRTAQIPQPGNKNVRQMILLVAPVLLHWER